MEPEKSKLTAADTFKLTLYRERVKALKEENINFRPFMILHSIMAGLSALLILALIGYKGFSKCQLSLAELGGLLAPSGSLSYFVAQILSAYNKSWRTINSKVE